MVANVLSRRQKVMLAWKELALYIPETPYCADADERPQNVIFHQTSTSDSALFARIKLVLRERNTMCYFENYNLLSLDI